jgi:hypothetical protein
MRAKRLKLTAIILIGTLILGFLLWKNPNSTNEIALNQFALKNPNQVVSITLTPNNKKIPYLVLEKFENQWLVKNATDSFLADTNNVHHILYNVAAKLQVKNPVSEKQIKAVSKFIASDGTKVIFKYNDGKEHTFFVGPPTNTELATYMYMPDNEKPCEVVVPGFTGYVTPNFTTNPFVWKSPFVIDVDAKQIQSVSVTWTNSPQLSFIIQKQGQDYALTNTQQKIVPGNPALMDAYLELSKQIAREVGDIPQINRNKSFKDSLLQSKPLVKINYQFSNPKLKPLSIAVYPIPNAEEEIAIDAKPNETQTQTTALYWIKASNDPIIWTTQEVLLKNRLKTLTDFQ